MASTECGVILCFVCFFHLDVRIAKAQTYDDVTSLHSSLLSNYDKYIRPLRDLNDPVIVNLTFGLVSINKFDEVSGEFTVSGFLFLSWYDHRLEWDPDDFNNTYWTELHMSKVWTPTITLVNSNKEVNRFGKDFYTIFHLWFGLAMWAPGDIISSSCTADVTYYPFDKQTCILELQPWGFGIKQVILKAPNRTLHLEYFTEHGTWELLESYTIDQISNDMSYLSVVINMRRRPTFFIVTYILPILFMIGLNILVFFLPVESGERMSYSITVLLAVAVFLTLVGENLPKTSLPVSYLCYFLLGGFILSSVCCCMTIVSLKIYYLPDDEPVPTCLRILRRKCVRGNTNKNTEYNVDLKSNVNAEKECHLEETKPNLTFTDSDVTWKMVSSFVDKVMIIFSFIALFVLTTLYFTVVLNSI